MAVALDSKQVTSFEELLMSQVVQQGSPHSVACGKRDIYQRGVHGDGEGGGSGDGDKGQESIKRVKGLWKKQ